jgi:hypothetical protein
VTAKLVQDRIREVLKGVVADVILAQRAGERIAARQHAQPPAPAPQHAPQGMARWATPRVDSQSTPSSPPTKTIDEEAEEKLAAYITWCRGPDAPSFDELPWGRLLQWWRDTGTEMFPTMADAFRVLLAVPGGSADLEADFSSASNLVTKRRSRLDAALVEVCLLLHLAPESIPSFERIKVLSEAQAKEVLPRRIMDRQKFREYLALDAFQSSVIEGEQEQEEIQGRGVGGAGGGGGAGGASGSADEDGSHIDDSDDDGDEDA